MATPEDAQQRDTDTVAVRVLRKRLRLLQAAYDELLADVLAAKRAYYAQRDELRAEMKELVDAIEKLEADVDEGTE